MTALYVQACCCSHYFCVFDSQQGDSVETIHCYSHISARCHPICAPVVAQWGCFSVGSSSPQVSCYEISWHPTQCKADLNKAWGRKLFRMEVYLMVWRFSAFSFRFYVATKTLFFSDASFKLKYSKAPSTTNVGLIPHTAFKNHWKQDADWDKEIDFPTDWFHPGSRADLKRKTQ